MFPYKIPDTIREFRGASISDTTNVEHAKELLAHDLATKMVYNIVRSCTTVEKQTTPGWASSAIVSIQAYVLSANELNQIISDAIDHGAKYGFSPPQYRPR